MQDLRDMQLIGDDLQQGDKWRPIDDYSVNGHNTCVSLSETVDPSGVDTVVGLGMDWLRAVDEQGVIRSKTASGEEVIGELHGSLTRDMISKLP